MEGDAVFDMLFHVLALIRGHEAILWWLGVFSIVTFFGSLIALPMIAAYIPADYFVRVVGAPRYNLSLSAKSGLQIFGLVTKNIVGIVLIVAGIAMLVLPGQGMLFILVGMMLTNFPGKRAFERRIIGQRTVLRALNWMRAKAKRPPIEFPAT